MITDLTLKKEGDMITLRISGNGFLYNMVRIIVGTLLKVGTGYYPPAHVEEILDARNRSQAGPKAPAHGLTLVSIIEEEELKKEVHIENKYMDYIVVQREIMSKQKAYIIINRCVEEDLTVPLYDWQSRLHVTEQKPFIFAIDNNVFMKDTRLIILHLSLILLSIKWC